MSIGHDSNKALIKRNAELAKVDIYLDRILSTMDEYPSEYRTTLQLVTEAHKELLKNPKKAGKLVSRAYHAAIDESTIIVEFRRIIDRITPEDPVLKEKAVESRIESYKKNLKSNNLKGARKDLSKLDKIIGGRGEPTSMQIRLVSSSIKAEDGEVSVVITNVGKKDIIINEITSYSTVSTEHVELIEPVVRSGNSITQKIKMHPTDDKFVILNLTVTYTKEFIPVTQKFAMKVLVE